MASGKKRRGPKPQPAKKAKPQSGAPTATAARPPAGSKPGGKSGSAPKAPPAPKARTAAPARRGISKQWWIVIGVAVLALVAGIVVQSTRSKTENTKVVIPKHKLGPNQSEVEGADNAPVLVHEYADFQCPSCKQFHDRVGATVDELVADGKIRFAYSYFPFLGPESVRAAAAAMCAGDQGKFFPYQDLLYTNQAAENSGFLTTDRLVDFGEEAGITGSAFTTFEKCVRADTYEGFALQQAENASKAGISSTPTVLVTGPNGKTVQLTGEQTFIPAQFEQAVAAAAKT